jgi:hypothetical protein
MLPSSTKHAELHWQWAEGRAPSQKLVVRLDHVATWTGGPFGIGKSPSLPTGFLDPVELRGTVLVHEAGWNATKITLVLPAEELPVARVGDRIGLAVAGGDYRLCICAGRVPAEQDAASLSAWLAGWTCKTVGETIRDEREKR